MDNSIKKIAANKFLSFFGRIITAGIVAFCVLNVLCIPYYYLPIHTPDIDQTTNHKWEPNRFYSRATEGSAWGKINNDGFINNFDYTPNMHLDVLVMGSSHMEALNVGMDESTTAILNKLLGKNLVYNIGISGHYLLISASNLKEAVSKYKPSKFVVIETSNLTFSDSEIKKTIDNELEDTTVIHRGIKDLFQRIPYIRLIHSQMVNFFKLEGNSSIVNTPDIKISNELLVDALLEKIKNDAGKAKVIILYHPGLQLKPDKSLELHGMQEAKKQFERLCKKHDIIFLDMGEKFKELYEKDHILAYGFPNSAVGAGHLNKYGHAAIAEKLYELIKDTEA